MRLGRWAALVVTVFWVVPGVTAAALWNDALSTEPGACEAPGSFMCGASDQDGFRLAALLLGPYVAAAGLVLLLVLLAVAVWRRLSRGPTRSAG